MGYPTWTIGLYLDALRDNLRARPGLDGIRVDSAPVSKDDANTKEIITFVDADADQEPAALGPPNRQMEATTLEGIVHVLSLGKGEDVAVKARNRALELFAEVEDQVGDSIDQGLNVTGDDQIIRYGSITRKVLRQGIQDRYRRAVIEFDITITTKIR